MIKFKELTIRNFLSVGNATQAINLNRNDLTLVLGENLDLGGDGSRNGVGKTAALNAISYALYGSGISNIRKDNLINKTNAKNMLVTLSFELKGQDYYIERGRRPGILKFFVSGVEKIAEDAAQGDSRETQAYIESMLGLSHEMFKQIIALNTYNEPFLSLGAGAQRSIIEQLLGITQLSERGERLKELIKKTKDEISQEEFRVRAINEANKRIEEQIESLKKRQKMWLSKQKDDVSKLQTAIDELSHVDIEVELKAHTASREWQILADEVVQLNGWIESIVGRESSFKTKQNKLKKEIEKLENNQCYACGQDFHDEKHSEVLEDKKKQLQESALEALSANSQLMEHSGRLAEIGDIGSKPEVFYPTLDEAYQHRSTLDTLQKQLETRVQDLDPYGEQIEDMQNKALQIVDYTRLNDFTKIVEHQEFLHKLLTNKDSFVRKRIIEQNLAYLNSRLTHYLDHMGLPHTVTFENDLSVQIQELGRELDFDNLSRGERNRLILSLSWAFRDVWEALNTSVNLLYIDEMIDNGLDTQGVESALGILKSMSRERRKSIWLVSHRDELIGRVESVLTVRKENGFTSFEMSA